ncbi:MAG: response regulator transcription factor [Chloroflexia bacterium]|nr:response regulator transcription factor [Chloroflexia bacterium]
MTTILIVEDELAIATFVRSALRKAGFEAHFANTGAEALELCGRLQPDLLILDLTLPDMDGLEICRHLRARPRYTPIIMLTARAEDTDRVVGLELGADDYVTKPFSIQELIARVRAVLRLAQSVAESQAGGRLRFGDLEIDLEGREALVRGRCLDLTPTEFDLLALLAAAPGRVFDRETLLRQIWGYPYDGSSRAVDVHVQRLRQKIGDDPQEPRYIHTVRGMGYKFSTE